MQHLRTIKNHATSLDKKNHATSRDKKITKPLGTKKITQSLGTKTTQPLGQNKDAISRDKKKSCSQEVQLCLN